MQPIQKAKSLLPAPFHPYLPEAIDEDDVQSAVDEILGPCPSQGEINFIRLGWVIGYVMHEYMVKEEGRSDEEAHRITKTVIDQSLSQAKAQNMTEGDLPMSFN